MATDQHETDLTSAPGLLVYAEALRDPSPEELSDWIAAAAAMPDDAEKQREWFALGYATRPHLED